MVQIVVTLNPEARVNAAVAAPMPPPGKCGEAVEIAVRIVNEGFVTAPLRARIVGGADGRIALHMDAAKLSGRPEALRDLHLIPLAQGAMDLTLAFSIDDNAGDLAGRDRVHLLVRCGDAPRPAAALTTSSRQEAAVHDDPPGFLGMSQCDLRWTTSREVPGVEVATVFGEPGEAGHFVMRVRIAPNIRIAPHSHIEARTYTILAGEWRIGFDDPASSKPVRVRSFHKGDIYRLPALLPHYQESGPDGAVIQIEAIGPSSTDFTMPGSKWSRIG